MGDYSFDGTILGQHATVSDPVSGNQTWEKVISKNLGADLNMFSNRLSLTADFYIRDTKGILGKGKSLPSIYGANEPQVNSNNLRTKGYELVLGWRDSFKLAGSTFSYGITGTFSDYTAEYTKCDNPSGLIGDPYVGKKYGEIWGYKVDGLFRNDEEAAEYASRVDLSKVAAGYYSATGAYGKGVRGGDIKYLDLDGSGIVDGGKGQLSNAYAVLCELGLEKQVPIVGLAKRLEEIYYPGDPMPYYLSRTGEPLKVVCHIRDEAHRFGITFHRQKRSNDFLRSELKGIAGIGPRTVETLLGHFRTVARIRNASDEELIELIGAARTQRLRKHFASS